MGKPRDSQGMDGLTEKQRRFVEAYAGPAMGNATEAARRAGYKGNDKTLSEIGRENLGKPGISSALAEISAKVRGHAFLDVQERQLFLARVAAGEVDDWVLVDGVPMQSPARLKERMAASDQLNKMQSAYVEKREVEHKNAMVTLYVPDNGRRRE